MEIERVVSGSNGIPFGYFFSQNERKCWIKLKFRDQKPMVVINQTESSISVREEENDPLIYGITFGKFYKYEVDFSRNELEIELYKDSDLMWPILISAPLNGTMDMKSIFVLGLYEESKGRLEKAFDLYMNSHIKGFIPAKVLVSDNLLSDTNNYNVTRNEEEAIRILLSIPIREMDETLILHISSVLAKNGKKNEARNIVQDWLIHKQSQSVTYELACLLSPFMGGLDESEQAVTVLESLVEFENAKAIQLLSLHLYNGIGCEKNKQRAKELDILACNIDKSLQPQFKDHGITTSLLMTVGFSSVFVFAVLWALKKKKE